MPERALEQLLKLLLKAQKTRKMDALVGRASYVAKEELSKLDGEGGLPDPGAIGLAALLDGLVGAAGY